MGSGRHAAVDGDTEMVSDDLGKNLMSINILIKKHAVRAESVCMYIVGMHLALDYN